MLSYYSWDNIAQVKTLCNIVQEAPDKIAWKKYCMQKYAILFKRLQTTLYKKKSCAMFS